MTRWICWVRHRFYSVKNNGCVRHPGDRAHRDCGWYSLTPFDVEELVHE